MRTYKIEVSAWASANPASNRQGLWTSEGIGESTGLTLRQARAAANAVLKMDGVQSSRIVSESTGKVV